MLDSPPESRLDNYRRLISRVDDLCRGIETEFSSVIACTDGCDGCCRHLSLFPVEAAALATALQELPLRERERIRERARDYPPDHPCPLLEGHRCTLYGARPLICRTHGLPLLINTNGVHQVDYCPLNFQGISSLPGGAVINLDQLNEILVTVNLQFVATANSASPWPERLTIAQALATENPAL